MITSLQNQRIKDVVKLANARERRQRNLFVIEGSRELSLAIIGGYSIRSIFICRELLDSVAEHIAETSDCQVEMVSMEVFRKKVYREQAGGVIALVEPKRLLIESVQLSANPFVIVLEAVEKPGNLGAILRTADAAHADAVVVCDPLTDIYNPNTIRSSIGCLFTQQLAACRSDEAFRWLEEAGLCIFAAELTASEVYYKADFTKPTAIVMGAEASGLTDYWINNAHRRIRIPMCGCIDSLNVSVSAAVITFEAMRQRCV